MPPTQGSNNQEIRRPFWCPVEYSGITTFNLSPVYWWIKKESLDLEKKGRGLMGTLRGPWGPLGAQDARCKWNLMVQIFPLCPTACSKRGPNVSMTKPHFFLFFGS